MFIIISNQIIKMVLLIIVGYICYHAKLIDHNGNKTLSNVLLLLVNPILIIDAFQMEYSPALVKGLFTAILLSILAHIIGIPLARFLFRHSGKEDRCIEQLSSIYGNCGFMGIPLVSSILGNEGILYITAYIIVFNIFIWTHGLTLITGNTSLKQIKKGVLSPVVICCVLGLLMFLCRIRLPGLVSDTISYISGMNTPLAMLIAGVSLAETDILAALKRKNLYLVTAGKLILFPVLILLCFSFLPIPKNVYYAVIVAAACPTATTGMMFALRFNKNYKYASEIFAFTTICSMITIPGVIFLAEHI